MTRDRFLSEAKDTLRLFDALIAGFVIAGGDYGSRAWRDLWRRREKLRREVAAVENGRERTEES